jgi:hypothetical protein
VVEKGHSLLAKPFTVQELKNKIGDLLTIARTNSGA